MLPHFLPVPVRVDLLALANVPAQDDDGSHDCDDRPQPLVVPLHVVQEEADALSVTRPIVLTVQELLS